MSAIHPRKLSGLNVWALSIGCVLGWGSFIMPGTTFLPVAGPAGTAIAMSLGVLPLLCIVANFTYMMESYPENGGAYCYVKHVLGVNHAFLCAWALIIAYLSLIWANSTAFTFTARYLLGSVFQWGPCYTLFTYDIYLGECLVTLAILLVFSLITTFGDAFVPKLQTALALTLIACIAICCTVAFMKADWSVPAFAKGYPVTTQVLDIAALLLWAFVGFESIMHSTENFSFPIRKSFTIMLAALVAGALVYIALTCLAALFVPDGYTSWREYVADLDNLKGLERIPTFQATQQTMGNAGSILLGLALVTTLSTSLLGFMRASSRLISAVAKDGLLPAPLCNVNRATYAIFGLSVAIPFLGRTVIGWLTDITSICVSLVYLHISLCCWIQAKKQGNIRIMFTSFTGMIFSVAAFLFPLVPNLLNTTTLTNESYLVLAVLSLLGCATYLAVMWRNRKLHLGQSPIIWIVLLFLLFFAVGIWAKRIVYEARDTSAQELARIHSLKI